MAQANYAAAKGGIVSLVRSAAAGMYRYGVTSNCIAPVAKTRLSGQVPMELQMGEPEDVAPMVVYLLSDQARHITGQVYTVNGPTIAVWDQPHEVRSMDREGGGRWTPRGDRRPDRRRRRPGADGPHRPPRGHAGQAAASGDKPNQ